jgi:hypothetical protein
MKQKEALSGITEILGQNFRSLSEKTPFGLYNHVQMFDSLWKNFTDIQF